MSIPDTTRRRSRTRIPRAETGVPQVIEQDPCRKCGGRNVHRSRARNAYERIRKLCTKLRPFHCHDCGWRAWLPPLQRHEDAGPVRLSAPLDFEALDEALAGIPARAHRRDSRAADEPSAI